MKVIATLKNEKKVRLEVEGTKLTDDNNTEHTAADIKEVFVVIDNEYKGIPHQNFLTYLQSYSVLE